MIEHKESLYDSENRYGLITEENYLTHVSIPPVFSDEEKKKIRLWCKANRHNFNKKYDFETGEYESMQWIEYPEKMRGFKTVIFWFEPGDHFYWHTDGKLYSRECVLIDPLIDSDYSAPEALDGFAPGTILLNTTLFHRVDNTHGKERFNVQLCFDSDIYAIQEKWDEYKCMLYTSETNRL